MGGGDRGGYWRGVVGASCHLMLSVICDLE